MSFVCVSGILSMCVSNSHANRRGHIMLATLVLIVVLATGRCIEPQAPRFIKQPSSSSSVVSEGHTKILKCQAYGSPPPVYRWLRDGKYIDSDNGRDTGDIYTAKTLLRLANVRTTDSGRYQCVARNSHGVVLSDTLPLNVAYMSTFGPASVKRQPLRVQRGNAALITLPSIRSVPKPEVRWMTARGVAYGEKYAIDLDGNLVVLDVDIEDQTDYSVTVTNTQLGSESETGPFSLKVIGGGDNTVAPSIVVAPRDVQAVTGQDVKLLCIINASPLSSVETVWLKDGVLLTADNSLFSYEDPWRRSLSLLAVTHRHHAATYTCRSRATRAPHVQAQATVTVLERPSVVPLPANSAGDLGRQLMLSCAAEGRPAPRAVWFRDAVQIGSLSTHNRYSVLPNDTLVIGSLRAEDAGVYQCVVSNDVGQTSTYTWLRVKSVKPVMTRAPSNVTVLDGHDATLSCRAQGAPPPNTTWTYNGKLLEDMDSGGRLQVLDNGDLIITNIDPQDSGLYTCTRANQAGSVSASAFLSTMDRTQVQQPPADTHVVLGNVAILSCLVHTAPAVAATVRWRHHARPIGAAVTVGGASGGVSGGVSVGGRVRVLSDGSLRIAQARATDVGEYTCQVTSPGGNVSRSAQLRVVELPYAPTNVRAHKVASLQRTVRVGWSPGFDGHSPLLKYIVQSRRVPISSMISGNSARLTDSWTTQLANVSAQAREVTLVKLTASAAYQFRVSAVNAVGEGATSQPSNTVLLPQEAPSGPPLGLVGSARSRSEIMIQWSAPASTHTNGLLLGYVVRYRLHGYTSAPWTNHNISNQMQQSFLIVDLITWKDYDIEIAAFNARGTGVFSAPITVKTSEGVPGAAPTDVHVQPLNSTAVTVKWTPPDPQLINGINQGYKLQAWLGDAGAGEPVVTATVAPSVLHPLARQTATLAALTPYTDYHITVLCFTAPGNGVPSQPVKVTTLADVPGVVSELRFANITDRSVTVLWRPPRQSNGPLTGYTVHYHVQNDAHTSRKRNVSANVTTLHVSGLKPSTEYEFSVRAWTAVGAGLAQLATLQSGVKPVLPVAATRLAVSNIGAFSVVLQFTAGFNGNSSIIKWTVQALTPRNASWHEVYSVSGADTRRSTIEVASLVPFTKYRLRLLAHNIVGASGPSEATPQFQTIQAPPSHAPSNVSVRALSAQSLRVGWIPLQQDEWYGVPRGYNITYRSVPDASSNTAAVLHTIAVQDHNANSYVLEGLAEYQWYDVQMSSYNDVGSSTAGQPVRVRTRESVPSAGPESVTVNSTSSTTAVVTWSHVAADHRNGLITGYKVYYGHGLGDFQYKLVEGNSTHSTTLTQLRKYTEYRVQVLAQTRLGDGTLSTPPVLVQTHEDVPGAPSNVSFPDVSYTFARVIWEAPARPNGVLLGYRVSYHLQHRPDTAVTRRFEAQARTYKASGLLQERTYVFSVAAESRLGWGEAATAVVYTTNNRRAPQPPSQPLVSRSQTLSDRITFTWTPGPDGYSPLRYYTVQMQESGGGWQELPVHVQPTLSAYTVTQLQPFTTYRFRIQATNDRGPSGWSLPSVLVKTLAAAPSGQVGGVRVVPITTTSVRVEWRPLAVELWSGDALSGGYRLLYRRLADFPSPLSAVQQKQVADIRAGSMVIDGLERDANYEVSVAAFNSQGEGPSSPPVQVYVGEAFPTGWPLNVSVVAVSSSELRVSWLPPPVHTRNGAIQGYKVFYTSSRESDEEAEQVEVVPGSHHSVSLLYLDSYTNYSVQMLAFNMAGDGPRSQPITARTLTGIPGPPGPLQFSDITMTSLKISWSPPARPNGVIQGYLVMYETAVPNEDFSKQVKQKISSSHLQVRGLEERVAYSFSVRALTVEYGAAARANVTTGPQPGSPASPRALLVTTTPEAIQLYWQNGASGSAAILGYIIEARLRDESGWRLVERTRGGSQVDYSLQFSALLPASQYALRLMAFNKLGVSLPVQAPQPVATPSKLLLHLREPFYRRTWFMVSVAAVLLIALISVTAVLCVKSKSYKYKRKAEAIEETLSMEALADGFDIDQRLGSRRATLKRNTLARKSGATGTMMMSGACAGAAPPRPTPGSVAYNSDTESKCDERHGGGAAGGGDDNSCQLPSCSSSCDDKPSNISSSESQVDDEDDEDQLYYETGRRSLVAHYSNMNSVCRQSWKRQRPVPSSHLGSPVTAVSSSSAVPQSSMMAAGGAVGGGGATSSHYYANHTGSENEGSAVMSLNGAEIVVNNRAGSRAPLSSGLNAFSSFV